MTEKRTWALNGFIGLLLEVVLFALGLYFLSEGSLIGVLFLLLVAVGISGFFIVQPNEAKVLIFFGQYLGSVRRSGFWWGTPFTIRKKVSLRVRNFNSSKLKVNDVEGNPIEIAAVVVFRVVDSAKALFDVDNYETFVEIQSETALRHIASSYPYDTFEDINASSLRGNADEVAAELARELQQRLQVAGVEVLEARLTHLAYATEIAGAMLQRQQAAAIIAARQKIVEGAVGMVQMAVNKLKEDGVIDLDEERKAAMVNNLMVAIVSEREAHPVINTGTIY
ncbi:SPFH domain-containing protein [Brevibacillus aydinogluensis]|jgi:regulator of protease activity HflC (stomatin/prohibitin superfamily)|uniref:PHB domain-containing protein n=1 Tax=Brevibacillus aydinogluensis TaxID=927786 RepID=A0AA48MAL6_9BACL|nr:SPFH domain-containing protein [Brevibacillus aydinogluensis]CAJ1003705.1 PHB domain-containing protein [Brevibacillus aydinogluensis]